MIVAKAKIQPVYEQATHLPPHTKYAAQIELLNYVE